MKISSAANYRCNLRNKYKLASCLKPGREENGRRNYVMINLHESIGPARDGTQVPCICSQTRFCSQTGYLMHALCRNALTTEPLRSAISALYQVLHEVFFVLLLYVPSQQLWSWPDGQFTSPHLFLSKLEQAVN